MIRNPRGEEPERGKRRSRKGRDPGSPKGEQPERERSREEEPERLKPRSPKGEQPDREEQRGGAGKR